MEAKKAEAEHKRIAKEEEAEKKRLAKEEKRKSTNNSAVQKPSMLESATVGSAALGGGGIASEAAVAPMAAPSGETESTTETSRGAMVLEPTAQREDNPEDSAAAVTADRQLSPPGSPKGDSKVKSWIKSRFSRRLSRGARDPKDTTNGDRGFVGGVALTGSTHENGSTTSLGNRSSSVREVAMAGKATSGEMDDEERPARSKKRASIVSSASAVSRAVENESEGEFEEARDTFDEDLAPPPTLGAVKSSSPVRDSKFHEVI